MDIIIVKEVEMDDYFSKNVYDYCLHTPEYENSKILGYMVGNFQSNKWDSQSIK